MTKDDSDVIEITETEDIQKLLLGLLKGFHNICERYNLYYVVFGGTMLGAVRHQGMIPWDDDIDVCMPRKDYEKFCEIVDAQYSDIYTILNYPKEDYIYDYAKFCLNDSILTETEIRKKFSRLKLYIDVFPVDGYPPCEKEKEHFDKLRFYHKARCYACYRAMASKIWWKKPYVIIRYLSYLPYRIIGYRLFQKKLIKERQRYKLEDCEYVSMQGAGWNEKGKLLKETFLNRRLYDFDGIQVWGITDFDEHLKRLYGDYMTPPSEEKQVSNHSYKLYVKKEYLYE